MGDKRDRDPFENRYSESEETEETTETAETSKSAESSETVRSRKNVNMYLPEDLVTEMNAVYAEVNADWVREHGEDLPKNEEFYPAVVRGGLDGVREELGLD